MSPVSITERVAAPSAPAAGIGKAAGADGGGPSFADTLGKALDAVNTLQMDAQAGSRSLADGTAANLHDVTIAMEQANIALQLTATVRNRVVEAYQEIMRMSV